MINIDNYNVSRGHTLNLQKMRKNEMHTMQSFWDCVKWKQMKIYAHGTFCCMILFSHEFILGVGQKNTKCLQDKMLIFMFVTVYCPVFLSYKFVFLFICLVRFGGGGETWSFLVPFLCCLSALFFRFSRICVFSRASCGLQSHPVSTNFSHLLSGLSIFSFCFWTSSSMDTENGEM